MNSAEKRAYSVKELSDILKACFDNPAFSSLSVYGEVYSVRLGKFSYLEIGDQGNKQTTSPVLKCAFSCFYGNDYGLESIQVGDVVQIQGKLSYYAHGSSLTLWGNKIEVLQGQLGKNLLLKRKTLEKLDKLGYLDPNRKRPIPRFVKKVAILTASTGAAYQDILKTLHDRFPVDSVLYPIVAQGSEASRSIVSQMERVQKSDCEVIILGRGGGSKTDLSCFDDEKVALSIAESRIPVITCIGHTIDTAIADRVSDKMAITPTEGASLINPSKEEIRQEISSFLQALDDRLSSILYQRQMGLAHFLERLEALSPRRRLLLSKRGLDDQKKQLSLLYRNILFAHKRRKEAAKLSLKNQMFGILQKKRDVQSKFLARLSFFDPATIEKNGYALLYKDGRKIRSSQELGSGDEVILTFTDGRKKATVL